MRSHERCSASRSSVSTLPRRAARISACPAGSITILIFSSSRSARSFAPAGSSSATTATFPGPATITASISSANRSSSCAARTARSAAFTTSAVTAPRDLLEGPKGHCGGRITCPYHAWTLFARRTLVGVPHRETFRDFHPDQHGLVSLEQEIFMGFIFVRFEPGLPSVREMAAPYVDELAAVSNGGARAAGPRDAAAAARQLEERRRQLLRWHAHQRRASGPHAPVRPELWHRSAGLDRQDVGHAARYAVTQLVRAAAIRNCCRTWTHLPPERQRLWTYFKLWPNVAFDIYPDQIDFMQFLPVSPTETMIREIAYVHPDAAARCARRAI